MGEQFPQLILMSTTLVWRPHLVGRATSCHTVVKRQCRDWDSDLCASRVHIIWRKLSWEPEQRHLKPPPQSPKHLKESQLLFCLTSFSIWSSPPNILDGGPVSLYCRQFRDEALVFPGSPCCCSAVHIIHRFRSALGTYILACHLLGLPSGAIQNKSGPSFA